MPGLGEWIFGSSPQLKKKATGTAAQQQFGGQDLISLLQQMMGQGGGLQQANQYDQGLLQGGFGNQGAYDQFSAPYLQQFQEQIAPRIAEQFAGMGGLSSSGFAQALGGAGAGLQSQLAQLFSQLQGQAAGRQQNQFQGLSQLGLGYQPFAYHETPGSQGIFGSLLSSLAPSLVSGATDLASSGFKSLFNSNSKASPLTGTYDTLFRTGALT